MQSLCYAVAEIMFVVVQREFKFFPEPHQWWMSTLDPAVDNLYSVWLQWSTRTKANVTLMNGKSRNLCLVSVQLSAKTKLQDVCIVLCKVQLDSQWKAFAVSE